MERESVQSVLSEQSSSGSRAEHSHNQPLLSVRDLRTYYFQDEGIVKAVDGATFDVQVGRTLGVVGESGCGKSVTSRSILRLIEKHGRIVDGKMIYRRSLGTEAETEIDLATLDPTGPEIRSIRGAEIALIFQEPMTSLSPVHTIGAQIVEAIMLHQKLSEKKAYALGVDTLHRVGIPLPEQRMAEYRHQLSGGLRQRAMIALALSCDPRLLIADEPTTSVDVTTQAQILDLLRTLQANNGMAIMFITHNLGVIAEIADEVVVMYLGRVVEQASVDDLFHAAKHPYTKALLRSIPSFQSVPGEKLPTISGSVPHPYDRPPGCPFHPRCEHFMPDVCDLKAPQLLPVTEDQAVSCFLYHQESESGGWDLVGQ
jgi:oligopeptide/dipeptide ABC transporter ATP-binding protein